MIKTKIAMAMSIAGVLVAGSAAALVNTQVLGGSTSAASPLVIDNGSQVRPATPTVTVATTATMPVAVAPTPAAPAAAPSPTQAVYAIGDAGTVTLDTARDMLTIIAVTPTEPWIVTKSEGQDSTDVEVKFQNGTSEVEFHANLLFGVVTTAVDSHDSSAASNSTSNSVDNSGSGRPSGGSDDSTHGGGGGDD